jgi:glycosyltransferase involved in cell wall biosynthesis
MLKVSRQLAQRPRLSVCMIVRDEARVLSRCLDSLEQIHDELCIVDTGSRDATIEIARSHNAIVRSFSACNGVDGRIVDFAVARNAALEMATGEWILQIDADEIIRKGHARIRRHVNQGKVDQIGIGLASNGAQWVSGRLFRRTPNVHYRSRIHEYVVHEGSFLADRQIVIENLENKTNKESSSERNIRLCLLATQEDPGEARNFHYLGNEYRELQKFEDAIACYSTALQLGNYRVGLFHSAYYLAICYLLMDDLPRALEAAFRAVQIDPRYAEGHCLLGDIYSSMGNIRFAIQWYRSALTMKRPPTDAVLGIQAWAYQSYPKQRLEDLCSAKEGSAVP